jgi:hypothetical protein
MKSVLAVEKEAQGKPNRHTRHVCGKRLYAAQ